MKKPQLDQLDEEALLTLKRSRGWKLVEQRIGRTQMAKMAELLRRHDDVEYGELRGFVDALHLVTKIPDILIGEARTKTPKDTGEREL